MLNQTTVRQEYEAEREEFAKEKAGKIGGLCRCTRRDGSGCGR